MNINKTTGWSLGTTGLCIALVAGGWFGLVDPQRAAAAESREATVAAQDANAQLEIKIEQLRKQFADLPAEQAKLDAVRQALPEEPGLAQLIRDLHARSHDASTRLDSITSGAPVAVVDPAAVAVVAEGGAGATADGEAAGEPAPEASAEPSAPPADPAAADPAAADPAATAGATTVPQPPAAPVLAAVPVTITATGDFAESTLLLKNVQADMPRALLVDSVVVSVLDGEDVEPGTVQSVITGRVFVFVDPTETEFPGATPATEPSDG